MLYSEWYQRVQPGPKVPEVEMQNRLLRRELGSIDGNPCFQWRHWTEMFVPAIIVNKDGTIRRHFHCACGVDKIVHEPNCRSLVIPVAEWELRPLISRMDPEGYAREWIMAIWQPARASRTSWEDLFGGAVPYPSSGWYVPMSDSRKVVATREVPYRSTTEAFIRLVRGDRSTTSQQKEDVLLQQEEREKQSRLRELECRYADAFTVHEGRPGEKANWSAGGVGESPLLRKEEGEAA